MSILANRVVSRFTGQLYFFDVLKKILGVNAMWACAQNRGNFGMNFAPVHWAIIQRDFAFFISPDDEGRRMEMGKMKTRMSERAGDGAILCPRLTSWTWRTVVAHGVSPLLGTKERLSSLLPSIVYTERTKGSPFPTNQFSRRFLFPQL